jgi:hypothetical protein
MELEAKFQHQFSQPLSPNVSMKAVLSGSKNELPIYLDRF